MSAAAVLTISRNGENIKSQEINGEVLLGRGEGCVIRLDDRAVSRQHALLRVVGDGVQIEKKSDFAPIMVNGAECAEAAVIKEGDVVSIGPYLMRVKLNQALRNPAPTPTAEGSQNAGAESGESSEPKVEGDFSAENGDVAPAVEGVEPESNTSSDPLAMNGDASADPMAAPVDGFGDVASPSADAASAPDSSSGGFLADDGDGKTRVGTVPKILAKLHLIAGMASPEELTLNKAEVTLGRGQACDLILSDKKSSRKHAVIRQNGIRYIIKDLDSANGTLVNGEPIREHELSSDDVIKIGEVEIQFQALNQEYEEQKKDFIDVPSDEPEGLDLGSGDMPMAGLDPLAGIPAAGINEAPAMPGQVPGGQPVSESPTGGVSGIAGIGASTTGQKQTLIQKFRALPPKKQAIFGAVGVALLWFLFEDDPEPVKKPAGPKKAAVNKDGTPAAQVSGGPPVDPDVRKRMDFQKLTGEQKKFVEAQYALAFDFYRNKEYDKTLFELEKIFVLVQDYERAREIESYAKEGKRKVEALQEEKRRKDEEEKLKRKVLDYEKDLQASVAKKDFDKAKEIIVELLTLDPENKVVNQAKKSIEAFEDQKRLEEQQRQVQQEINGRAADMIKQGRQYQKQSRCYDAIDTVAKVPEIGASDAAPIEESKKIIAECKNSIRRRRDPILQEAKNHEQAGEFRKAFELYQKATRVDSRHPAGYAGMNRIRDTLHQMAKVVYTEAILAESYSDFKIAQDKFKECMSIAPEDDIYFVRSKSRLGKYIRHEKRRPAAVEKEGGP